MDERAQGGGEQARLWNGAAGEAWVAMQDVIDVLFAPIDALLCDFVAAAAPRRILDVGCGTGGTTVAVAKRLDGAATCLGVDISEAMVAAARARAAREHVVATFVTADAETHAFDPSSVDAIVSRFGVMFFADPIAALTNLRRAAAPGAPLRSVVWRSAAENPFMTAAELAAAPLLPELPVRREDEPGQFGFADRDRVAALLERAGWRDVEILPFDAACSMPASALVPYVDHLGPVGRALAHADDALRARVMEVVLPAFEPHRRGDEIRFTAACWAIGARA